MDARAQLGAMPRALIVLLTIALLVIGAVGGYAIGSGLVDASDGGDPLAGLTYSTQEGAIFKHATDGTGDPVQLTADDEFAGTFAWSPDGMRLSYESWIIRGPEGPITLMIRDADGSNPVVVSEPFAPDPWGGKPTNHAWSPDGSRIIYSAYDIDSGATYPGCLQTGTSCGQRIWSAATDGSELARVIGDPELDARSPVWTPDGESIVFAGSAGGRVDWGLYRMDADGANVERIGGLTSHEFAFDQIAISPDGTTAAVSVGPEKIHLVDLATGQDTLIVGQPGEEFEPYWSPDGSLIAFTNWGSVEPEPMLYDVASGEVTPLGISLYVLGWSPDSRSILGHWPADEVVTVVDVTDPTAPVATEVEGATSYFGASWQPRP